VVPLRRLPTHFEASCRDRILLVVERCPADHLIGRGIVRFGERNDGWHLACSHLKLGVVDGEVALKKGIDARDDRGLGHLGDVQTLYFQANRAVDISRHLRGSPGSDTYDVSKILLGL
jgi:hypothetical protein